MALGVLLASAVLLAACARSPRPDAPGPGHHGFGLLGSRPAILWVDWARCAGPLTDPEQALAFALAARETGITHLGIETRGHDGSLVLTPGHPHFASLAVLEEAARAAGLRLAMVHPLFLAGGTEEAPLEAFVHDAHWEDDGPVARLLESGEEGEAWSRRRTPHLAENRDRELDLLAPVAAASGSYDFLLLVEVGFPTIESDVGPAARAEFANWTGLAFRRWPAEVLGDSIPANPYTGEGRGPLWNGWMAWRARHWRGVLQDVRDRLEASAGEAGLPPVAVLVDAPYPMHLRQGVNWAVPESPVTRDFPWLPAGYGATASGHLLDVPVLAFWDGGMPTRGDAEQAGLAWWASMEGAMMLARRYRREESPVWAAIPVGSDGWAEKARGALEEGDGLVLISAGELLREPGLWEELGGNRPF